MIGTGVSGRLEGLEQLNRNLEELPKATQRNVLRRVLKKAAEPVLAAIEARAPRDTGYLSQSFALSFTLNPANRRDQKAEGGKNFAEIHIGTRRGSVVHFTEFGTVNQAAHPFVRPTWAAMEAPTLNIITTELGNEIERAVTRLARKAARLAA